MVGFVEIWELPWNVSTYVTCLVRLKAAQQLQEDTEDFAFTKTPNGTFERSEHPLIYAVCHSRKVMTADVMKDVIFLSLLLK